MESTRIKRIWAHRRVLRTLVRRDLRIRYARSWLGYLWTVIDPLSMGLVYYFVFGILLQGHRHVVIPFIISLLAGMLPWNWFNASITESARAIYADRLLIRSTNIPRELWVIRIVLAKGVEFLLSLPVLVFFIVLFKVGVPLGPGDINLNWQLIFIPVAIVMQLFLLIGVGLVMAPVTALVDDAVRLVRIVLRMLFYFTPIVYSMQLVTERVEWARSIMIWNPMVGFVDMYRVGLTPGAPNPDLQAWGAAAIVTVFWLVFGMWVFRKLEPAVLKEI